LAGIYPYPEASCGHTVITSTSKGGLSIMKQNIIRSIFRWIHIVFSIPILGYIYSPFEEIPKYAAQVRFVFVPVMILSGLWMWKGHLLRRFLSRRLAWGNEGAERT
jgi:hypothetical protein